MKCFYEVLELENECSEADIKSAYRRLALKWHPDKNDNSLEAKDEFQQIQHAYSILSNPQERDFYDRNKDHVLQDSSTDDSQEIITACIYTHFPSSCFKGYNDSENGFFTVYRLAFDTIAKKEREFMKNFHEMPSFGRSDTHLKVVAEFYDYWLNYSTEMHFAWCDVHRIESSYCRDAKKHMDRENKKKRTAARKEFTNYVREFVQLVKRRDTRMKAYQLERQKEVERKHQETLLKQEEIRRRRILRTQELHSLAAETAVVDEVYEANLRLLERSHARDSSLSSLSEEGEDSAENFDDDWLSKFYCAICEKLFKSENTLKNHNNSDRHLEKIESFKARMRWQDEALSNEQERKDEEVVMTPESRKAQQKKGRKKSKQIPAVGISQADLMADELNLMGLSNTEEKIVVDNVETTKKVKKPRRKAKNNADAVQQNNSSNVTKNPNRCQICGKEYPGKNKLFKHIKEAGHAALK